MLFKETWVLLCRAYYLSTVGHFWRRNLSSRGSFGTRFVCGTFWARFSNNWAHFKKTFGAFSALNDPGHSVLFRSDFLVLLKPIFLWFLRLVAETQKKNRTRSVEQKKRRSFEKKIQKLYFRFEFRKCHFRNRFVIFFFVLSFRFFFSKQRWERWNGWDVTLISQSIQRYLF